MSLSEHVRILGRGPGRARSLTQREAYDAMHIMLSGQAAPEAIGALLMLMRMKGETAAEIAGFASAAQSNQLAMPQVDLDWPCYAAGRTRGAPWLLLSARLVANAGHRVLLHGWNGADMRIRTELANLGIPAVTTPDEIETALSQGNIAYMPLESGARPLFKLLKLRDVLGLRSCINTVCRMLNPGRANASVQGVFHPSYRGLQADAAHILGWQSLSVIKGGGGEFERNPTKEIAAFGLRNGKPWDAILPLLLPETRRLSDATTNLPALWDAQTQDPFAKAIVLGTAALALDTLGSATDASDLWAMRTPAYAA